MSINVEAMKIIDERKDVIQGVLKWDEVIRSVIKTVKDADN